MRFDLDSAIEMSVCISFAAPSHATRAYLAPANDYD
jgi:hypothetical protein